MAETQRPVETYHTKRGEYLLHVFMWALSTPFYVVIGLVLGLIEAHREWKEDRPQFRETR